MHEAIVHQSVNPDESAEYEQLLAEELDDFPAADDTKEKSEDDYGANHDIALRHYLKELRKTTLLSAHDERELAARINQGDKAAKDKMVESNLRLVVKIAKNYANRGMPLTDLIGEGNIGLIKAVERFKLSKECRFSTYASWWIRQTIERALANQSGAVKVPVHLAGEMRRMYRIARILLQELHREPTINEVASEMGVTVAYVRKLKMKILNTKVISLDSPTREDSDYCLLDSLEDTSFPNPLQLLEMISSFEMLSRGFKTLGEQEQKVISLRYGFDDNEPHSLQMIGQYFGVTRERIRQVESRSLAKLRKFVDSSE